MEYHVQFGRTLAHPDAIEDAIRNVDPAATIAIDPAIGRLRVSTWFELPELLRLLAEAGEPVGASQVVAQPSTCCGGCSG